MTHDAMETSSDTGDAHQPASKPRAGAGSIIFYVVTVVLTAGDAMLVRLGNDGFWFGEAALFPLAFLLCLLGPNGMIPTGLIMMGTLFAGWFLFVPGAAAAMEYLGVFLVVANAALIFVGAFLGSLLRTVVIYGLKTARASVSENSQDGDQ